MNVRVSSGYCQLMIVVILESFKDTWLCGDDVVVLEMIEEELY